MYHVSFDNFKQLVVTISDSLTHFVPFYYFIIFLFVISVAFVLPAISALGMLVLAQKRHDKEGIKRAKGVVGADSGVVEPCICDT
jgi:hypothetical protein